MRNIFFVLTLIVFQTSCSETTNNKNHNIDIDMDIQDLNTPIIDMSNDMGFNDMGFDPTKPCIENSSRESECINGDWAIECYCLNNNWQCLMLSTIPCNDDSECSPGEAPKVKFCIEQDAKFQEENGKKGMCKC